jgi:hypothetical protein
VLNGHLHRGVPDGGAGGIGRGVSRALAELRDSTGTTAPPTVKEIFDGSNDVHGSVLREPGCAAELVSYFTTGRIDRGCDGIPAAP